MSVDPAPGGGRLNTMRQFATHLYTRMPGVMRQHGRFLPPMRWLRQGMARIGALPPAPPPLLPVLTGHAPSLVPYYPDTGARAPGAGAVQRSLGNDAALSLSNGSSVPNGSSA